jgi:endoribonuclease Dicer
METFLLAKDVQSMLAKLNPALQLDVHTVLECLTAIAAHEGFNYEMFEIVGDSVLKLVVSIYQYRTFPEKHEGQLTEDRKRTISNKNLFNKVSPNNNNTYLTCH